MSGTLRILNVDRKGRSFFLVEVRPPIKKVQTFDYSGHLARKDDKSVGPPHKTCCPMSFLPRTQSRFVQYHLFVQYLPLFFSSGWIVSTRIICLLWSLYRQESLLSTIYKEKSANFRRLRVREDVGSVRTYASTSKRHLHLMGLFSTVRSPQRQTTGTSAVKFYTV